MNASTSVYFGSVIGKLILQWKLLILTWIVSTSANGFSAKKRNPSPNSGCPDFMTVFVVLFSSGFTNSLHLGLGVGFLALPCKIGLGFRAAAIAPWFCLHLPSCSPGFESQAHHLRFFKFVIELCCEKNEKRSQNWTKLRSRALV